MSQKKVDAYKESKKNRKAEVAKEKRQKKLGKVLFIVILVAAIIGLGVALFFTFRNTFSNVDDAFKATDYLLPDYANIESTATEEEESTEPTTEEATEEETDEETEPETEEETEPETGEAEDDSADAEGQENAAESEKAE